MGTNVAAILKMVADQSLIFRISTGFLHTKIQYLLHIGSELMNFFSKMATNVAVILKMAANKILVARI